MSEHAWRFGAAAGALAAVGFLLSGNTLVHEAIWLTTLLGSCAGIVLGVRWHRPARQHPWWILFTALALLSVGNIATLSIWSSPLTVMLADYLAVLAFPLIGAASLALVRVQAPGGDRESAIDGLIVMVATATLLAGTVFAPDRVAEDVPAVNRVLTTAIAPLVMAAVTAAVMRLLFVANVRLVSAWLLFAGAALSMIGRTLRALFTSQGIYEAGIWTDTFILLAYVGVALASLHPSSRSLTEEAEPRDRRFTHARLGVLGVSLIAAPATLVVQDTGEGLSLPVVSSVILSLLVLWRLSQLVFEREAARKALHLRAEQQQALAELGVRAAHEHDLDELTAEAQRRCTELLGLRRCVVTAGSREVSEPGLDPAPAERPGHHVELAVSDDGGTLFAEREQPWNPEDRAFLQSVANVLAGAVERHTTNQLIRSQAIHDGLTGLPNRVHLMERLEQAHAAQRRSGEPMTVMFLDLDEFKRVNDTHGHRAGDQLLIAVAERLRAVTRASDTVGRLAGDEFVVISERTDLAEAHRIADRVVSALDAPYALGPISVRVGVSLGIAVSDGSGDTPEQLLAQADHAMYAAKIHPDSAASTFERAAIGEGLGVDDLGRDLLRPG